MPAPGTAAKIDTKRMFSCGTPWSYAQARKKGVLHTSTCHHCLGLGLKKSTTKSNAVEAHCYVG